MNLDPIPWGDAVEGLAMRLQAARDRSPAESEVDLFLELRNVGERSLTIGAFGTASIAWLVRARIFDPGGRPLPSSGPIIKSGGEPRLKPIEIAPGETVRLEPIPASSIQVEIEGEWIPLNSRPGSYWVQLVYEMEEDRLEESHWSGSVTSNRIRLSFD